MVISCLTTFRVNFHRLDDRLKYLFTLTDISNALNISLTHTTDCFRSSYNTLSLSLMYWVGMGFSGLTSVHM